MRLEEWEVREIKEAAKMIFGENVRVFFLEAGFMMKKKAGILICM